MWHTRKPIWAILKPCKDLILEESLAIINYDLKKSKSFLLSEIISLT